MCAYACAHMCVFLHVYAHVHDVCCRLMICRQLQQQQAELEVHQRDGLTAYDLSQVTIPQQYLVIKCRDKLAIKLIINLLKLPNKYLQQYRSIQQFIFFNKVSTYLFQRSAFVQ